MEDNEAIGVVFDLRGCMVLSQLLSLSELANESLNQSLKRERSSSVWIALATLFLVMATSVIALSILMGCILHKKTKTQENSSTCIAASSSGTNDPMKEGRVSHVN